MKSKKRATIRIGGEFPSTNKILTAAKMQVRGRAYSSMKKKYTAMASKEMCKLAPLKFKTIYLNIDWGVKTRRSDPDNISGGIKFILDGMVDAGIIEKDNWSVVKGIRHTFSIKKDNPRVKVNIIGEIDMNNDRISGNLKTLSMVKEQIAYLKCIKQLFEDAFTPLAQSNSALGHGMYDDDVLEVLHFVEKASDNKIALSEYRSEEADSGNISLVFCEIHYINHPKFKKYHPCYIQTGLDIKFNNGSVKAAVKSDWFDHCLVIPKDIDITKKDEEYFRGIMIEGEQYSYGNTSK